MKNLSELIREQRKFSTRVPEVQARIIKDVACGGSETATLLLPYVLRRLVRSGRLS